MKQGTGVFLGLLVMIAAGAAFADDSIDEACARLGAVPDDARVECTARKIGGAPGMAFSDTCEDAGIGAINLCEVMNMEDTRSSGACKVEQCQIVSNL